LPATPETVALYLASKADTLKPATLGHRLAAISKAHSSAGYESPASMRHAAVSEVLKGIRRTKGVVQDRKAPLLAAQLIRALATMRADLVGLRDRALLLVGFSGAFRRSELVALDVSDVQISEDGITVTLRRSKNRPGRRRPQDRHSARIECGDVPAASAGRPGWPRRTSQKDRCFAPSTGTVE